MPKSWFNNGFKYIFCCIDVFSKHNIQIIFALGHAPFVGSFNKTMKNRMMKYMKLKSTANWSKNMNSVLDKSYNNPHSITKIAPNKVK